MSGALARVLVVDDEAHVMELIKLALGTEGFEVIAACTGKEALEMAVTEKPDIVLLDINLPDINGIEVCKQLKAGEDTRRIPVLFLSALSQKENTEKCLAVGAVACIFKPFPIKPFVAQIRNLLSAES